MKKKILFILFISGCFLTGSNAQSIAVKSNLLYDATSTLNMGVELGLSRQWTLDVPLNYNPWKPGNGRRLRHWGIQPEARYWFCERFNRTFVGLHGHYADFNVGGFPDWGFISKICRQSLSGIPVWRRHFNRTFMDFEETLEFGGVFGNRICAYCI
mgnify:CR=1 FL=1